MVPLSLAIATSTRVSYWLGAGDAVHARKVVHLGFKLAALSGIALAATIFIANHAIASLYSGSPAVVTVASGLLVWVAAYHVADACQTLSVFVLRSYRITVAPLVVYCVMLWGVGLGGGYLVAYGPWPVLQSMSASPAAFWACSALALAITAVAFTMMLLRAATKTARAGVNAAGWQGT
jgi:MATE family multidrug resistance protein